VSRRRSTFSDESEWGGGKGRQQEADLDITPMIDVTFLLLIFFMVASTMQAQPDMSVPAAKHGEGLESRYAVTFFVTTTGGPDAQPKITDTGDTSYSIEEMAQRAREEIRGGKRKLILRSDGRVPAGFIDKLLRSVQDIPDVEYAVGVREKR